MYGKETMLALVNTGPGALELLDVPMPTPGPGQALIRTLAVGICATDLHMIAGWPRTGFPAIPGHEWCGQVAEAGPGVDPSLRGATCVGDNVLADGGEVGFEHPGGYASYFVTEAANLHRLPAGLDAGVTTLAEPLAVCLRGLRKVEPPRSPVLIVGDGPIGLISLLLLRRTAGLRVALLGGRPSRLDLARELGADVAVSHHAEPVEIAAQLAGNGFGSPALVVEASGSADAADRAVATVAPGGSVLVMGDYGGASASFAWNRLLHGEVRLLGSNTGSGAWAEAAEIVSAGKLPLEKLITHGFRAGQHADALALVRDRTHGAVKVVLHW
ncbi:MAG: zinc-binding dehydrogenase [Armatimonadetes bacterium]|nr:zinc-binding dehydrogenase [Armatimonadota bacterium]